MEEKRYGTLAPRKKTEGSKGEETKKDINTPTGEKHAEGKSALLPDGAPKKKQVFKSLKENKKNLLLGGAFLLLFIACMAGIFILNRKTPNPVEVQTETGEGIRTDESPQQGTVSGKDVKQVLLSWEENDRFAIVVGTKQLLLDKCSYNINYLKYLTDERGTGYNAHIDGQEYSLKCINYGNCFKSDMIFRDGEGFRFLGTLMEEPVVYQGHDKDGNEAMIVGMKTTNPWDGEKSISIRDEELFYEYDLYNGNGETAGVLFLTTGD